MPSITSWTRLEPRARSEEMTTGLQAKVHDPLWLLARQWQLGEFRGEDAGSPVMARLQAELSSITRFQPGRGEDGAAAGQPYDSLTLPLETMVERERIRDRAGAQTRLAAEAGLHFLRLLAVCNLGNYRNAYLSRYAMRVPTEKERQELDDASLRFLEIMAQRVPDGARLYADLRAAFHPSGAGPARLPSEPAIAAADRENAVKAIRAWLQWYETLFSEPAANVTSWTPERMEYEFAVSASTPDGEVSFSVPEYAGGHLDWYSFDTGPKTAKKPVPSPPITRAVIPTPVAFHGMPAPRWWEFENAQIDFGALEAGPEDLVRLMMTEFALVYGNDWFVVPFEMAVGSVCRILSLEISDSFGERTLIRSASQVDGAGAKWRMFGFSPARRAGSTPQSIPPDVFFLPPVLAVSLQSSSLEETLLMRDEMANMAWAVERIVESHSGDPLNRSEAYQEKRRRRERERTTLTEPAKQGAAPLIYRLASAIPDYWIPLLPFATGERSIGLRRGVAYDELLRPIEPQSRFLKELSSNLHLAEEESPRSGSRLTRAYQYARWIDGSTHLWAGRRKQPGRGEGSSGLRFDMIEALPDSR